MNVEDGDVEDYGQSYETHSSGQEVFDGVGEWLRQVTQNSPELSNGEDTNIQDYEETNKLD